eukprot:gene4315-4364_t
MLSATLARPTRAMRSSALARILVLGKPRSTSSGIITFSAAVKAEIK